MITTETPIGFSTGCLHKVEGVDIFSTDLLDQFRSLGCTAIELNALHEGHLDRLESLSPHDLRGFEYISLHGPAIDFTFKDDKATTETLDRIESLHQRLVFQSVVIHPDRVEDWSILEKYIDRIPFSVENMDIRKPVAKDIDDFDRFIQDQRYSVVIDLQHCLTNDSSHKLANDFLRIYSDRITHTHLSGYDKSQNHWPLFKTSQDELIRQARSVNKPIIIESTLLSLSELALEMGYIKNSCN
jgi:hypothetical protein